jgi:ribonuclease HI
MRGHRLRIFFDGGCRPNPGMMEIAIVARGRAWITHDLGHGTSADAEWLALLEAVRIARSLHEPDFVLLGDSAMVVDQANGVSKCRSANLQAHLESFRHLAAAGPPLSIRHIKRSQNLAGIALAKTHDR